MPSAKLLSGSPVTDADPLQTQDMAMAPAISAIGATTDAPFVGAETATARTAISLLKGIKNTVYDALGAAADAIVAAGAAGSISAKLRRVTQGLEDLKTMIVLGTGVGATQVQGTAADGVAPVGNPVQIGGVDGGGLTQRLEMSTFQGDDIADTTVLAYVQAALRVLDNDLGNKLQRVGGRTIAGAGRFSINVMRYTRTNVTLRTASGNLTAGETTTAVTGFPLHGAVVVQLNVTTLTVPDADDEVDFWLQTSFDSGTTWRDIANVHFAFGDVAATKFISVVPPTASITNAAASDGALADNTITANFPIGDRLRFKTAVTGATAPTYAYNAVCAVGSF